MQQFAPVVDPENPGRQLNGKPQAPVARRALGDIGNLGNALSQKVHGGKDAAQARPGVLTRRAAAQLAAVSGPSANNQNNDSWGTRPRASLRPRDASMPVVSNVLAPMDAFESSAPISHHGRRVSDAMPDIDSLDKKDPLAAVDFIHHMMAFYQRTEPVVRVAPDYMSTKQTDINDKMRAILVDWLVDVHIKFKLMDETLHLTMNLIDRYLEVAPVGRRNLQLVGVTAMLVASKYEEIWAPEVRDFVYISDRAYNRDQILQMEKNMLNLLKFNLTIPTTHHFLQRFIKAAGVADETELVTYAKYLVELALPDYASLSFPYSKIAAAAVSSACAVYGRDPLPRALARHSGYSEECLRECINHLGNLYRKASSASLTAVFKKYDTEKYSHVSTKGAPPRLSDVHMDA